MVIMVVTVNSETVGGVGGVGTGDPIVAAIKAMVAVITNVVKSKDEYAFVCACVCVCVCVVCVHVLNDRQYTMIKESKT